MTDQKPFTKVTADDVAAAAGVSRWTVTRAFKSDAPVSAQTRANVLEAAKRIGYLPDLQAASLGSDRSNLVALLIDDFKNPHKLVLIDQLTRTLRAHGWDSLLLNTLDGTATNDALLTASQRRVDAAVLIGIQFNDATLETAQGAGRVKRLIVFARSSEHPSTLSISVDDTVAMATIADHVLAQGYQSPLFLAGPQTGSAHLRRRETFLTHWKNATGQTPPTLDVAAYDATLAFDRIARLLHTCPLDRRPDVIVCENDALAMGTIDAIRHAAGLRAPEDIAVTGFDDIPQAQWAQYQLTSYRQPIPEMAQRLVAILQDTPDAQERYEFNGELVVRASA